MVAVEPGPGSLNVLSVAADLAQRDGRSLSIMTVSSNQHQQSDTAEPGELLAEVPRQYPGLPCTFHTLSGKPAAEIVHAARGAELLVVGTRGFGGLSGLMHGSVSQSMLQLMSSPLLVVPQQAAQHPLS